jgi:hypothetical protein
MNVGNAWTKYLFKLTLIISHVHCLFIFSVSFYMSVIFVMNAMAKMPAKMSRVGVLERQARPAALNTSGRVALNIRIHHGLGAHAITCGPPRSVGFSLMGAAGRRRL